jgi:competence ComEA-like helix-hairpin-helix protein
MAQLGDDGTETGGLLAEAAPQAKPVHAPEPTVEEEPAPAPAIASAPELALEPPSVPVPIPEPVAVPQAISEPKLEATPEPLPSSPIVSATVPAAPPADPDAHAGAQASVAFNLNTCTAEDLVQNIPGCFKELAESIVEYRTKIGSFKRIEELLDVPGITKAAYTNLTGEAPPDNRIALSLNELLGFPPEQHISLKDVTERIACWPDVTGCVLSQSSGLSLVGTVPEGVDKAAIVAFAPRMFEAINKSFAEVSGQETDALVIPSTGTSFHLFRNRDLYLIIMSRLPQMPERHVKVARFVLAALSIRRD